MNHQDLTQMAPTGEDPDDAGPVIDGWSAFWAVLLGVGFVVHMMFAGISDQPRPVWHWRLQFFFVLLAGVAITAMALAGLSCMMKSRAKPPAAQDLARTTQHDLSVTERTHDLAAGGNDP